MHSSPPTIHETSLKHGKFISTGLGEMKSSAPRKGKYRLHNLAARSSDLGLRFLQSRTVEDDERAPVVRTGSHVRLKEPTVKALVREGGYGANYSSS